jgi:hypothetical protein
MKINACKGAPNFELNTEHDRTVSYTVVEPDNESKGLVFFISCFGLDQDYIYNWLKKISDQFNLTAVSVQYHCWHSRPETGASIIITPELDLQIRGLCAREGVECTNNTKQVLNDIGSKLTTPVRLDGLLLQDPKELQNFGIIQALDHLYVLDDIIKRGYKFDLNNIILFGSSHGGYISHLIAKLAPNTIRLIIDNSSYISPPPNYMGLGSEYVINMGNLSLGCSTMSSWQHQASYSDNYYNIHNKLIRDVANFQHFCLRPKQRSVQVIAYNTSEVDGISPKENKQYQKKAYRENGFYYNLNLINYVDEVFKSKGHGMDASLLGLFKLAMGKFLVIDKTEIDLFKKTELIFDCHTADYIITHGGDLPVEIEIKKHRFN